MKLADICNSIKAKKRGKGARRGEREGAQGTTKERKVLTNARSAPNHKKTVASRNQAQTTTGRR